MQVKVFESPDMATGLRMVRKELGADALILSTRSVRNSKLGILGKSMLEITAAVDDPSISAIPEKKAPLLQDDFVSSSNTYYAKDRLTLNTTCRPEKNVFTLSPSAKDEPKSDSHSSDSPSQRAVTTDEVKDEIIELKRMIELLSREVSGIKAVAHPHPAREDDDLPKTTRQELNCIGMLKECGISSETGSIMADLAHSSLPGEILSERKQLTAFFQEIAAGFLRVSPPEFEPSDQQKRIAFVGPTGVGKTTTLAKVAAHCLGKHRKSVGLITIDTYRIAAVEQLKVYGEIMGLPVEVVLTPRQFQEALQSQRDKDIILIDTAGRSPKDSLSIEELSSFMDDNLDIEKHLVLSAATREAELVETISQFQKLNLDRTIFTKIDECSTLGTILNTQLNNPNPLSYLTNGQRVPEDLLEIDSETVARLVIPSVEGSTYDRQ